MSFFYEAGAINASWLDLDLARGWNSLEFAPNSEAVTYSVSADGIYTFNKSADSGCTITMTLPQTSPLHKEIAKRYALQKVIGEKLEIAPFTIEDPTGDSANFIALNAVLTEQPTNTFEAESGDKTWVWVAETYINTEDPSTVLASIDTYIKTV